MQLKDYYSILELSPSASLDEIKKAYRRLAHQYHPDKKANDPYAATLFAEIKEAYETLSHTGKKEIYLQQRWYAKSIGKKNNEEAITPVSVLKKMLILDQYTSKLDVHRMDKKGLLEYLLNIFSDETIEKLKAFNEPDVNKSIIEAALKSSRHLNWSGVKIFYAQLIKLSADEASRQHIHRQLQNIRNEYYWNKYSPWIMLAIVLIICLVIFMLSH